MIPRATDQRAVVAAERDVPEQAGLEALDLGTRVAQPGDGDERVTTDEQHGADGKGVDVEAARS